MPAPGGPAGGDAPAPAPGGPGAIRRDKARDYELVGKVVADKYRVLDVLGQGAFGTVYLVEITAGLVGEKLAMKVLPEELSSKPAIRTQFIHEIRVAMRLVDRYIVQIRDVGTTEDGLLYYTMDYCPGKTLAEVLRREGRLPVARAVLIVSNVLRALQTAHAAGIVHRDLKPANIMIEEQAGKETVRVLDFGIATAVTERGRPGQVAGTPAYMPPEQFLGEEVGFASDLYSVGAILYECVTGEKPHGSGSAKEVFQRLKTRAVTPPEEANREVAAFPGLSGLILKCLERNPERRFRSAKELFDALNAVLLQAAAPETARPAKAPAPRAARPAAAPPPAARAAAERIRRQRQPISSRRPPSRWKAVVAGLFIVGSVTAGVIFRNEIQRALNPKVLEPPKPEAKPSPAKVEKPAPPGPAKPSPSIDEVRKTVRAESARRSLADAQRSYEKKDWAGAVVAARRALEFDPESAEARRLEGLALLGQNDPMAAAESLERARSALGAKADRELLLALAQAKIRLPDPDLAGAEAIARGLVGADPEDVAALELLARILGQAGRGSEVEKLIQGAKSRGVASKELDALYDRHVTAKVRAASEAARALLEEARSARARGEVERALELARRSSAAAWRAEADLFAVECLFELGRLDEARKLGETARARAKTDLEMSVLPSGAIDRSLPPEGVRKRLDAVLQLIEAEGTLARAWDLARPSAEGLEAAKAAEALLLRAEAAIGGGGAESDPLGPRLALGLARVAALRGDARRAKGLLEPLLARKRPAELWAAQEISRAAAAATADEEDRLAAWRLAARALSGIADEASAPAARRAEARYLLARCQLEVAEAAKEEGLLREAIEGFDRAEREGHATPELYEDWGRAYASAGNLIRSARCLRRAYELAPTPERCLRAADAYLSANPQSQEAREILKDGKVRFPDHPELRSRP